ncbi:MAG: NUDIX domain-containing protein [archaeon]
MEIPEEKYKEILELMPIACVDLVIFYCGKIFLAKRINEPVKGQWFLPGGRIMKNEKLNDVVMRKAKEETGLDVKIIKPLMFDETMFNESSMKGVVSGVHTVNLVYLVEAKNNKVKLDAQNSEYKWIDIIDENWHPYVKRAISSSGVLEGLN